MSYTAEDFRRDLEEELSSGYNVVRIARAAFRIYQEHAREIAPDLKTKVFQIIAMEEGPEFEFSEQELRDFSRQLTESCDNDSPSAS